VFLKTKSNDFISKGCWNFDCFAFYLFWDYDGVLEFETEVWHEKNSDGTAAMRMLAGDAGRGWQR
jgi:hypothetical protein